MTTQPPSTNDPRIQALQQEFGQKRVRFFVTIAVIEGALLVLAALAVFVLGVVPEETGVWLLVAIALFGGLTMTFGIMSQQRAYQRAVRDITGY